MTDPKVQLELLTRDIADLHTTNELLAKLGEGRPLHVKFGADPSAPDLHLGHSVPLRKLRHFQELGHLVIIIIGDFTARIGDPSGRSMTRPVLTREQVEANTTTYLEQLGRILDLDACHVRRNSEWFDPMTATELLALASRQTR